MISGYPLSMIICQNRAKNKIPKDHSPKPGLRKKFRITFKLLEKRIFQLQIVTTRHKSHVHSAYEYVGSSISSFLFWNMSLIGVSLFAYDGKIEQLCNFGKNFGGEAAIQRGKVTLDTAGWWLRRQSLSRNCTSEPARRLHVCHHNRLVPTWTKYWKTTCGRGCKSNRVAKE